MRNTYVVLLRGINVGGKNKVSMATLREFLEELGFFNIMTSSAYKSMIIRSWATTTKLVNMPEEIEVLDPL